MKNSNEIYESITNLFIQALEEDRIPWVKPFNLKETSSDFFGYPLQHINAGTKKLYRGINILVLELARDMFNFSQSVWLTFNQAKQLGLTVKKGSKSIQIYFKDAYYFKKLEGGKLEKIDLDTYRKLKESGVSTAVIPFLKKYNVFNIEQTEGEFFTPETKEVISNVTGPKTKPVQLLDDYQMMPQTVHGNPAYYPDNDLISMPNETEFESSEKYFQTFFHELIHSTGHSSRLNRDGIVNSSSFASHAYSKEELVAEIGASMLSSSCGIFNEHVQKSSKAYIQSWITSLKNDPKMIVWAASEAQKALDFILDNSKVKALV